MNGHFSNIKRSCFELFNTASGNRLTPEQTKTIKDCKNVDDLLEALALTPYWNYLDIRVLDAMATASEQNDAETTIGLYRSVIYRRKLFGTNLIFSGKESNAGFANNLDYAKIKEIYNKDPKKVTVGDFVKHRDHVEQKRTGLNMMGVQSIDPGCLEICWLIPTTTVYYAYCSIKKSCYLSDSIVSFEIDGYPIILCDSESAISLEAWLSQELIECKESTLVFI